MPRSGLRGSCLFVVWWAAAAGDGLGEELPRLTTALDGEAMAFTDAVYGGVDQWLPHRDERPVGMAGGPRFEVVDCADYEWDIGPEFRCSDEGVSLTGSRRGTLLDNVADDGPPSPCLRLVVPLRHGSYSTVISEHEMARACAACQEIIDGAWRQLEGDLSHLDHGLDLFRIAGQCRYWGSQPTLFVVPQCNETTPVLCHHDQELRFPALELVVMVTARLQAQDHDCSPVHHDGWCNQRDNRLPEWATPPTEE